MRKKPGCRVAPLWIPAFAGMTKSGSLMTYDARQGDFPFNPLPKGVRACIITG